MRYQHRRASPEIERAFRKATLDEDIRGMPAFSDLISLPEAKKYADCRLSYGLKSIKGVTVELSVTFTDQENTPLAVSCWKAGTGTSFRILKYSN